MSPIPATPSFPSVEAVVRNVGPPYIGRPTACVGALVRYAALVFLLLAGLLPARQASAQTPCNYPGFPPSVFQSCFKIYDYDTKQEITNPVLCAGRRINIRDCTGAGFDPKQVYYKITSTTDPCWPAFDFLSGDTVSTNILVPTNLGATIRIHQNTLRPATIDPTIDPNRKALVFARDFQVRSAPAPTFTLARCGLNQESVRVTVQAPAGNVQYFVQLGNGARQNYTGPFTDYQVNGATTITVFGRYTDAQLCEGSTSQPIPTLPTRTLPVITNLTVQGSSLAFAFAALQGEYRYELRQSGSATPVTVLPANTGGLGTYTLPNATLTACYTLRQTDACQTNLNESAALCPVLLTATAAERRNVLTWTTATPGITRFEIVRNEVPLLTLPAGTTTFVDSLVTCGAAYRYHVTAYVGTATSVSDTRTVTAQALQPPRAPQLTASFAVTGAVELTLRVPARDTADRLLVRRNFGGASQDLTLPRRLPYTDRFGGTVGHGQVPCYAARFADPCGNVSAEGTACPPGLDAQATDDAGNVVQLTWSAPSGQGSNWTYRLLLVDADGNTLQTLGSTTAETLTDRNPPADRQVLRYRVEATAASNGVQVFSNVASVTRQVRITVPNAFSPNGDGLNDLLLVKGRFLNNFTFTVYNRDGIVVFRTTDRNVGWDGRINGVLAAPQVFPFQVEVLDETGKRISQRGTVTILR